jgi:hypothetical protein
MHHLLSVGIVLPLSQSFRMIPNFNVYRLGGSYGNLLFLVFRISSYFWSGNIHGQVFRSDLYERVC